MLSRERAAQVLASERFDVLVIGGGITGAGVARVLGDELGWDSARVELEVDRFHEEAVAEGVGAW